MNPISQRTMGDLYMDTKKKVKFLKEQGYRVVEKMGVRVRERAGRRRGDETVL